MVAGHSILSSDLAAAAAAAMRAEGFVPEFPAPVLAEVHQLDGVVSHSLNTGVTDLRQLPWSSIDNRSSRDLDQIEVAERVRCVDSRPHWRG